MNTEKRITLADVKAMDIPIFDTRRDANNAFVQCALAKPHIIWAFGGNDSEIKEATEGWKVRLQNWIIESKIYEQPLSNRNLYLYFNTPRRIFTDMESGKYGIVHQQFAELCHRICAANRESLMVDGAIPASVGMFHQTNYDGMSNTQTFEIHDEAAPPPKSIEDIQERWGKYLIDSESSQDNSEQ